MSRTDIVNLARSYSPTAPTDPRYVELMRHPGDEAKHGGGWPERYYPDPDTYTCALTVLGIWRLAGIRHHLLTDAYRPGHATADMQNIARELGGYHDVFDLLAGRYSPRPGDAVMIVQTDGKREHAFTIVDVLETEIGWRLETVDGGHSVKSVKRVWRRGPGRITDDVDGRVVAYVVDAGALLAASMPDTDPAPDSVVAIESVAPVPPYMLGVDVSEYQRPADLDWSTIAKTHQFAIIRAGEALRQDAACVDHVTAAKPHVHRLGLYYVPHQDPPAAEQVAVLRAAQAAAGMDGEGHLLVALDLEGTGGRTPERYGAKVREIAELLGEVMIYLSPSFYLWMGSPEWLLAYPWWVAHYTDKPQPWCPWTEWAIWQHKVAPLEGYRGRGSDGAPLPIDQNRARRLPIRGGGSGYL